MFNLFYILLKYNYTFFKKNTKFILIYYYVQQRKNQQYIIWLFGYLLICWIKKRRHCGFNPQSPAKSAGFAVGAGLLNPKCPLKIIVLIINDLYLCFLMVTIRKFHL